MSMTSIARCPWFRAGSSIVSVPTLAPCRVYWRQQGQHQLPTYFNCDFRQEGANPRLRNGPRPPALRILATPRAPSAGVDAIGFPRQ